MGGGAGSARWVEEMSNSSKSASVPDCKVYERCMRVACCDSPAAVMCISASLSDGCRIETLVPPLSSTENEEADFGRLPVSPSSQLSHYDSWVEAYNCLAHVPCAWDRCFPGGGNFDGAVSDDVRVRALPGFSVTPRDVNLQQGETASLSLSLDVVDNSTVSVTLTLVTKNGEPQLSPVATLSPSTLIFSPGSGPQTVHVQWNGPGQAGMRFTCGPGSGHYSEVDASMLHSTLKEIKKIRFEILKQILFRFGNKLLDSASDTADLMRFSYQCWNVGYIECHT